MDRIRPNIYEMSPSKFVDQDVSLIIILYIMMSLFFALFVRLPTRCKIPECDFGENNREIEYDQPWLRSAIPTQSNGKLKNCLRYAPISKNETVTIRTGCSADMFNTTVEMTCSEFIYSSDEKNIQTEVRREIKCYQNLILFT